VFTTTWQMPCGAPEIFDPAMTAWPWRLRSWTRGLNPNSQWPSASGSSRHSLRAESVRAVGTGAPRFGEW